MPTLLHPHIRKEATEEARLIASYLGTMVDSEPSEAVLDSTSALDGESLFAEQNCNACHLAPNEEPEEDDDRYPLAGLSQKWKRPALVNFLQKPDRHYAWIRMPDFDLTSSEARSLTAYLMPSEEQDEAPTPKPDEIERGRELFEENHCLQCHALSRWETAPPPSLDWTVSDLGCLDASPELESQAPNFHLTPEEREGLLLFLHESLDSLNQFVPAEFAQRQMEQLRCASCHEGKVEKVEEVGWESFVSLGAMLNEKKTTAQEAEEDFEDFEDFEEDLSDFPVEATISEHQVLPTLVWAGEKLRADWMEELLNGSLDRKTRDLMPTRMPAFRSIAVPMTRGLSQSHGLPEASPRLSEPDPSLAEIGKELVLDPPGLNCIACHPIGDRPAGSGNQGSSINLEFAPHRLRRPFFELLLRNPQRFQPGSPMPQFIYENGQSAAQSFFEGDGRKQIEAIWNYLISIED
ncbi:MAG: c-type cytochrome [Candidatus Omnitrophica bacterium]|nr:c-type cytochrome [Candidatus Omnitrophota bacterium]